MQFSVLRVDALSEVHLHNLAAFVISVLFSEILHPTALLLPALLVATLSLLLFFSVVLLLQHDAQQILLHHRKQTDAFPRLPQVLPLFVASLTHFAFLLSLIGNGLSVISSHFFYDLLFFVQHFLLVSFSCSGALHAPELFLQIIYCHLIVRQLEKACLFASFHTRTGLLQISLLVLDTWHLDLICILEFSCKEFGSPFLNLRKPSTSLCDDPEHLIHVCES